MEEKIINELDQLDMEQTDSLLEKQLDFEIDPQTLKRIKASVYKKTGHRKNSGILKKITMTAAAAILLVSLSTAIVGIDNVAGAFSKLFSFIPGYGIVENNSKIKYVAEKNELKVENDKALLTLRTILATRNSINIAFETKIKNFDEDKLLEKKRKDWEDIENHKEVKAPKFKILINGEEYTATSSFTGGGGEIENTSVNFELPEELINDRTIYTLKYESMGLSFDFKLKTYDSYEKLEEIGPTAIKNNISITAVSNKKENILEVELYTINKSKYDIYSYTKEYDKGYEGKDLCLLSSAGKLTYSTPGSYIGANNRFSFDIPSSADNLVLNIPYIIVQSNESEIVSVKVPKADEILKLEEEVEFEDATMLITQVEKVNRPESQYGALKISFSYRNKKSDIIFKSAAFNRANVFGATMSGGYFTVLDRNDITTAIEFELDKGEDKELRLSISRPQYYLLADYNMKIQEK